MSLLFDEMKIREGLVFHNDGTLVGFVELGDINCYLKEFEAKLSNNVYDCQEKIADHILTVMVRGIFTPQLAGKARQLGCPKIVLDHVRVYIYMCVYICTTMLKYTLYWRYMNWRCTSNRNTSSSWSM